jgi:hypothetical protein
MQLKLIVVGLIVVVVIVVVVFIAGSVGDSGSSSFRIAAFQDLPKKKALRKRQRKRSLQILSQA